MPTYNIRFRSAAFPHDRGDRVVSVGLRLYEGDRYVQFYEVLAMAVNETTEAKHRACLDAISTLHDYIREEGVVPSTDPTKAIELHPGGFRVVGGIVPDFTDGATVLTFSTDD